MNQNMSYVATLELMSQELEAAGQPDEGGDFPADAVRSAVRRAFDDLASDDPGASASIVSQGSIERDPSPVVIVGFIGRTPVAGASPPRWPEVTLSRPDVRAAAFQQLPRSPRPGDEPVPPSPTYAGLLVTSHGPMDLWDDGERVFVGLAEAVQAVTLEWRGVEHRLLPLPGREQTFEVDGLSAVDAADMVDGEF